MISVTVNEGELKPPAYQTTEATSVALRDDDGHLIHLIVWQKDRNSVLTTTKGDEDFEWTAQIHNVPLHTPPRPGGIIIG